MVPVSPSRHFWFSPSKYNQHPFSSSSSTLYSHPPVPSYNNLFSTDGSKNCTRSSLVFCTLNLSIPYRLPKYCTILTAELLLFWTPGFLSSTAPLINILRLSVFPSSSWNQNTVPSSSRTLTTHPFLSTLQFITSPEYPFFHAERVTVSHLLNCQSLIFFYQNRNFPSSIRNLLCDSSALFNNLFPFLNETDSTPSFLKKKNPTAQVETLVNIEKIK